MAQTRRGRTRARQRRERRKSQHRTVKAATRLPVAVTTTVVQPAPSVTWTERLYAAITNLRRKYFPPPPTPEQIELRRLLQIANALEKDGDEVIIRVSDYPHTKFFGGAQEKLCMVCRNRISFYRYYNDDPSLVRLNCWGLNFRPAKQSSGGFRLTSFSPVFL